MRKLNYDFSFRGVTKLNIKTIIKRCIFLSIIFLMIPFKNIFALGESDLKFSNITIKDGLSQSSVNRIFQDSRGYMWFGTSDGLNKYDGRDFTIFREKENDKNSINSGYISAIVGYDKNNILVGTSKGVDTVNIVTNKVSRLFENEDGRTKLSNNNVWDLIKHTNGDIWIGTPDGLNICNEHSNEIKKLFKDKNNENSLKSNTITSLCEDKNGNVWVGTNAGINFYNIKTSKFQKINDLLDKENESVSTIYRDRGNNIWVIFDSHIVKVSDDYKNVELMDNKLKSFNVDPNSVNSMYNDTYGNYWFETQNGILKYDKETDKAFLYKNKYYDITSLVNNNVLTAYEDESGLLWFGTYNGISLLNPNQPFKHYKREPDEKTSISENSISGIYKDSEGILWLGTNSKGLNAINTKIGYIRNFFSDPNNEDTLSSNVVWQICEADKENLWVATQEGLDKLNKKSGKVTRIKYPENLKEKNKLNTRNLYLDEDGMLWIGSRGGLLSYNSKTGKFTDYSNAFKSVGIQETAITSINKDPKTKRLWITIGINGGVVEFDKNKGAIKGYVHNNSNKNSLINNSARCSAIDSKGNIWIGTDGGLSKLNIKTGNFTNYTVKDGLINNLIYGILMDDEGNLWMSTNGGLSRLNTKSNKFTNYTVMDGIQSNEFNGRSYFKSKDGELYFGGINGVTAFYPKEVLKFIGKQSNTKVVIDKVLVNNKLYPYYSGVLNLKYNQNNISIDFFLPDYLNASKITYEYKLQGVDEDWIFANKRNNANYTTLESGKYKLLIRARDNHGDLTPVTSLDIKVAPPPWRTPTAYLIYFITALIIIFLMWSYVTALEKTVKRRAEQLKKEAKEKENLLKEANKLKDEIIKKQEFKNDYFVNLSHDLRTPLNVIISTAQTLKELNEKNSLEKCKISSYSESLKRNGKKLLGIIDDIIDASKIESGTYKLNIEKKDIISLVEDTALGLKDYIESNNMNLIVDPEIEELNVEFDSKEIERCITNLLSNAIKYTKEESEDGLIEVYMREIGEEFVEISIKDNGLGIPKDKQDVIFDRFGQTDNKAKEAYKSSGLGLALVKSIVELHHGTIIVESEVGEGSTFIITLPINQPK